jgi:hypothetical protein
MQNFSANPRILAPLLIVYKGVQGWRMLKATRLLNTPLQKHASICKGADFWSRSGVEREHLFSLFSDKSISS